MAVKYKRNPNAKFDWNVAGRSTQAIRRKTLYIYLGLGIAFVASLAYHMMAQGISADWFGPFEIEATITEKLTQFEGDPAARYFIRCEIDTSRVTLSEQPADVEMPPRLNALVRTDATSWGAVDVGSIVQVWCRISPELDSLIVQRVTLDSLMVETSK
ncbi:MAG: hypothetical protein VCD00_16145 [Candidatus Hydrogenedentota bacterium]